MLQQLLLISGKLIRRNNGTKLALAPKLPKDPVEDYKVTIYDVYFNEDLDTESYDISWDLCTEEWLDESYYYELAVIHNDTIIDTIKLSNDKYEYSYSSKTFIDNNDYTFVLYLAKSEDIKSEPDFNTVNYDDPFKHQDISINSTDLYIIPASEVDNGYTLEWQSVKNAVKYDVNIDGRLYKNITDTSIYITDKNPNNYTIEIKAYNAKNTVCIYETDIYLSDPMDNVHFDASIYVDYYDDTDKISISGIEFYSVSEKGDHVDIPTYVKNRLNDKSLQIYIDGSLVKEISYDAVIPDIDVSDLDIGQHECTFKLVPIYDSDYIPKSNYIYFEKTACAIKECTFTPFADYLGMTDIIVVGVTADKDIDDDPISIKITAVTGEGEDYDGSGTFSFTGDEFREYLKNHPGAVDLNNIEFTIEITCEHGRTETLKTYGRVPPVSINLEISNNYVDEYDDYKLKITPSMTIEPEGVFNNISSDEVNVYIDNKKVTSSTVNDCYYNYDIEVDTDGISNGTHTVKLEYVNDIYGTFTTTDSFELNRCELENVSISVDGNYDSDSKSVTINYNIDTDESVDVTITNDTTGSSETSSSTSDTITFYEDSLEKGTDNSFTVIVNCEHGNEITDYCSIYVDEEESEEY